MQDNTGLKRFAVVHITGASGAGTTTLAKALSEKYGYTHLDTDDFFWEETEPPFTLKRERVARQALLWQAIQACEACVISGSLTEWGDVFLLTFQLVIYVQTQTDVRIARLREREFLRFGERILQGGDMAEAHQQFLLWAAQYDEGGLDMRSAREHEKWLLKVPCPVVRVDGAWRLRRLLRG